MVIALVASYVFLGVMVPYALYRILSSLIVVVFEKPTFPLATISTYSLWKSDRICCLRVS